MKTLQLDHNTNPEINIVPNEEVIIIDLGHHPEMKLTIGENAVVEYIYVFTGNMQAHKQAHLQTNATLRWHTAILGGNNTQEIVTYHEGNGANSDHKGIFLGHQQDRFEMNYWSDHTAQHTTSTIEIHGVLLDKSYADFKGNIKIAQTAADTNGSLTENTLLLGERSRSDSVPQLEIDTNDVQAAHSSAITRIDDEQLFYLQSRGIRAEDGKRMIVRGFLEGLIDEISVATIKDEVNGIIEERIASI